VFESIEIFIKILTMASSKLNIFNALPQHASDSEEEDFHKTKSKKTLGQKDTGRADDKSKNVKKTGPSAAVPQKQEKEEHARAKETRKPKGVSDQPHPQERHSGTGHSAYGGKPKKGGAGKGNWGKSGEEKTAEEGAEEETEEVQEEEKPEGITLQEYYSKQNLAQNQPKVNEAKAKITSEQLIKELGNSTLLKSRQTQQVDDRKVGKKKDRLDVNHHAAITTDHADLLGFRTGFIEKEYRQRGTEEAGAPQKRGPRTGGKPERERENAKEEETPATQTETQTTPVEGEQAAEGTEKTEGKETQNRRREGQGQGQGQGQRGGRGGYKGGEGYKGDRPRKDYGNKPAQQTKINFEDESAFPKLG
jgi:hypothetical protein